jgi:CheY-like chemotaxis protein
MPQGGRLTIATSNATLDSTASGWPIDIGSGDYVLLAISDTGLGMTEATQARVFEPFFTTKEVGKGTGLGLAICYAIIKQAGGYFWIASELGQGTVVTIALPRVHVAADPLRDRAAPPVMLIGTETVLLVEDEPLVRELARKILHDLGYTVLAAANGAEAGRILQDATGTPIDLLITDVVMPQIGGKALAEHVWRRYPRVKVLFISGYATDSIIRDGRLTPGMHFLAKPFTRISFARKVREVLDTAVRSSGADAG